MRLQHQLGGKFDQTIADLVREFGGEGDRALLVQEMIATALRFVNEKNERGELKIVNTALRELRYAFKIFSPYRHAKKVCVFGSARTPSRAPEYRMAKQFAEEIAKEGFMVITGAASGIMEAANAGAGRERSFGLNIRLPHEQEPNPYIVRDDKLMTFKYFFTRKLMFIKEASAIALFPGGFGTHDESFEALTLIQTGKTNPFPIVMIEHPGRPYWKPWFDFIKKQVLKHRYISPQDLGFFKIVTRIEDAVAEIKGFYRNYHSSRFAGNFFVLRVYRAPFGMAKILNKEFKDLLRAKSKFEIIGALPEEHQEKETLHLPRIAFHFNRKSYARIRELINFVNKY